MEHVDVAEVARLQLNSCESSYSNRVTATCRQQRDDLDRRENFMRRMIRLRAQRVPHRLGTPHVLPPRFLERGFAQARRASSARHRQRSRARRDRHRSRRTSNRRAIPAGRPDRRLLVIARLGRMRPAKVSRFMGRRGHRCRLKDDVFVDVHARAGNIQNSETDRPCRTNGCKGGSRRPGCSSFHPVPSSTSRTAQ